MTIVSGIGPTIPTLPRLRRKSSEFSIAPDLPMSGPVTVDTPGAKGVLGLQETSPIGAATDVETADNRAARVHGEELLGILDDLHISLLRNGGPGSSQTRLQATLNEQVSPRDPAIGAVVDAIRLRAAVEAARCEK